ncbi:MAG: methyltransferase family protein, partial [Candidatus Dormibacteria bacterium]
RRVHPRRCHVIDAVISIVWIAFWVYWLAAALGAKRRRSGAAFVGVRVRAAIVLLVFVVVRSPLLRGHSLDIHSAGLQAAGLVLFLLGLASAVWARIHLGANWGTPMSQKVDPELVTSGPYRYVRHPIYSGILLALTGTAVAVSPEFFIAVVAAGLYFVYSATVEERLMATEFPAEYPVYRARTRMLIPFVL